ncbi:MAG: hypothetical protein GXN91_01055, partial [Epsilonproteobacteria bacterium]|nr:hypothetical protein [Campylobacterota bacterium]
LKINKPSYATIKPAVVESFINGVAKDVNVSLKSEKLSERPFTIEVAPAAQMVSNSSWLLYNKYIDAPPNILFKIRFIPSAHNWSGLGKAGHLGELKAQGRRTQKIEW